MKSIHFFLGVLFSAILLILAQSGIFFSFASEPTANIAELNSQPASIVASGHPNPTCLDNYTSWNTSTTFKNDAPWSTALEGDRLSMTSYSSNIDTTSDINGDGLPDRQYLYHQTMGIGGGIYGTIMNDCIRLNNGHGWNIAYRCVALSDSTSPTGMRFYGDCAG